MGGVRCRGGTVSDLVMVFQSNTAVKTPQKTASLGGGRSRSRSSSTSLVRHVGLPLLPHWHGLVHWCPVQGGVPWVVCAWPAAAQRGQPNAVLQHHRQCPRAAAAANPSCPAPMLARHPERRLNLNALDRYHLAFTLNTPSRLGCRSKRAVTSARRRRGSAMASSWILATTVAQGVRTGTYGTEQTDPNFNII